MDQTIILIQQLAQRQLLWEVHASSCHGDLPHSKAHVRSCARLSSAPLISGIINQATNNSVKTQEINDPALPTESHSVFILNPGGNECKDLR